MVRGCQAGAGKSGPSLNYFKVKSRSSLSTWRKKVDQPEPRPQRMVSVVLPLLAGTAYPGRGRAQIKRGKVSGRGTKARYASYRRGKPKPKTLKQFLTQDPDRGKDCCNGHTIRLFKLKANVLTDTPSKGHLSPTASVSSCPCEPL